MWMLIPRLSLSHNQRFLIRNVSVIEFGLFINQLIQTLGSIALAHILNDPVRFGEVNLLLQIFGMVGLFLNVGFNSALVYAFATDRDDAVQSKIRLALIGSSFFGLVVSGILALLSPWLADLYGLESLQGALVISGIMLVFNSVINIGIACFSGTRSFGTQALFIVLTTILSTLGTVVGVLLPVGDIPMLWAVSFGMGIGSLLMALYVAWRVQRTYQPQWLGRLSLPEFWKMMKYGVPLWAGNIAKAFQQPFLVMVIGSSSVVAVGYIANGFRITGFIGIVTWAFMIVTFPFIAESARDFKESKRRGTLCIRYNNLVLFPLTLLICLYPNQINGFLFGESYTTEDSGTYIQLLALGVFFSSVSRLGGSILAGAGKTKANFYSMIVSGIMVIAIVPFIAAKHPVLAVWVYTIAWALSAIAMVWFIRYEGFPIGWWKAYGEPFIPTVAMGIVMEACRFAGMPVIVFVALGLLTLAGLTYWIEARTKDDDGAAVEKAVRRM
jgi:O-antigen/teichoic acid export membrane protein